MARPKKTGFDYFPFDVDLFSDYKVRKLMRHQGGSQAVAVYALLLCNIYRNGYYLRWDDELPFFMSETLGLKEAYIVDVILYCAAVGLFDKELYDKEKVLTSKGIQTRYLFICQQARRASLIKEYSLISSEETHVSSEKTLVSSEETPVSATETPVIAEETTMYKGVSSEKSTQRKEKKSKYTPPLSPPSGGNEGGGDVFSIFRDKEMGFIRATLANVGVSDDDAWEFCRLMSAPEVKQGYAISTAKSYAKLSVQERLERPFYKIIQQLQRMEDEKRLTPMKFNDFQTYLYVSRNVYGQDAAAVAEIIGANPDPGLCAELVRLVNECRKQNSKIQQPGKFILAGLRKFK